MASTTPVSSGLVSSVSRDRSRVALRHDPEADADHDGERGELDQRQHHVELDALVDAPQVDQREQQHEPQRRRAAPPCRRSGSGIQPSPRVAQRLVEADEEVGGEQAGGGGGAGDARADDGEGDEERHEVDAERLVRVERRTGGLRVLRHQLEVGQRGEPGDGERDEERQPRQPADLAGDVAGHRVDAGAEDVAHDEEQEQLRPEHPDEAGLVLLLSCLLRLLRHGRTPVGHVAPLCPCRGSPGQREKSGVTCGVGVANASDVSHNGLVTTAYRSRAHHGDHAVGSTPRSLGKAYLDAGSTGGPHG